MSAVVQAAVLVVPLYTEDQKVQRKGYLNCNCIVLVVTALDIENQIVQGEGYSKCQRNGYSKYHFICTDGPSTGH